MEHREQYENLLAKQENDRAEMRNEAHGEALEMDKEIDEHEARIRELKGTEAITEQVNEMVESPATEVAQTSQVEGPMGGTIESAEPHREETPFDRAMTRLDREDPERADRIRRTIGLEVARMPAGDDFSGITRRHYERERQRGLGSRVGSWIKERMKGLVTFGWWETHQAEKFRTGTGDVARDVEAQARLIRQEEGILSEDEALVEARSMQARFAAANLEAPTAGEYEAMSGFVTHEKIIANRQIEDRIVEDALHQLEERLRNNSRIQEYISYSGDRVITAERMADVEHRIRRVTCGLRRGQAMDDAVNYKGMIRGALDPEWYKRYVATGVEMVLGAVALKWVVGKMFTTEIAKGATEAVRGLKETVWDDTKGFLMDNGIGNPTDAQVLEASKMVAEDSGVTVGEWGISGDITDTKMPAGYLLKFGRVVASLAKIAAM